MGKEKYEQLRDEMNNIAETIKLFPEALQEHVFTMMVNALLDNPMPAVSPLASTQADSTSDTKSTEVPDSSKPRNYVEEFKSLVAEKDPAGKLNDGEFTVLATYYFILKAPPEKRVNDMTQDLLVEAFKLAKRRPPKTPDATFINSAHRTNGVERSAKGVYRLTASGEHFVENELPEKK